MIRQTWLTVAMTVAITALVAFLVDQLWFLLTLTSIYVPAITAVTQKPPNFEPFAAVMAWVSVASLTVLLERVCPHKNAAVAPLIGALVYAVYNFTVKSLFQAYTWSAVMFDIAWGGFITWILFHVARYIRCQLEKCDE